MKICVLTHDINPKTGWGRYASGLVAGIKKAGYDVLVLKEEDDGYNEGSVVIRRRFGILTSAVRVGILARDCDVIHALDVYPYGIIAWLASIFIKTKFIMTAIGAYSVAPLYRPVTGWFAKHSLRRATHIISISNYTRQQILNTDPTLSIDVVKPGIDIEHFYQEHNPNSQPYIVSVGAIKHRKGYHVSIPAFSVARKRFPGLRYIIVGNQEDKEYFGSIKKLAENEGVSDAVEFQSQVPDDELLKIYQNAKLFLLASVNEGHHFEGFGLVFLEAAASGLPVIGTTGNGISDAVNVGKNGILVPQEDIRATADAIIKIMSDETLYNSMSQESYSWVQNHGEPETIHEYLNIYKKLKTRVE